MVAYDQPLVLTTRTRPKRVHWEQYPDGGYRRVVTPAEPITQYGFKWFNAGDDGRLRGSYLTRFVYKKGWQEPQPNPSICSSGYHILNASHLERNLGAELWIVQVRGVVTGKDKSVAENVRPVVRVCTEQEWYAAKGEFALLVEKHLPRFDRYGSDVPVEWRDPLYEVVRRARDEAASVGSLRVLRVLVDRALGNQRPDLRAALAQYIYWVR